MPKSYKAGELYSLPVSEILVLEQKLRHDPNDDAIIELAASIRENTLLEPIGFRLHESGAPELHYGGRRLAAHKRLKETTIQGVYKPTEDNSVKTIALVENLQRAQLTLAEEIDAVTHLHEQLSLSPDQIAIRLSKSRGWVLRRLAIPQLPADLQEPVLERRIALGPAEELAKLENEGIRRYATNQAIQGRLTESQSRQLVEGLQNVDAQTDAVEAGVKIGLTDNQLGPTLLDCQACGKM